MTDPRLIRQLDPDWCRWCCCYHHDLDEREECEANRSGPPNEALHPLLVDDSMFTEEDR